MKILKQLRRNLDTKLETITLPKRPKNGWIKEIRTAIGMTEQQLATRLDIDQSTLARLQRAEAEKRITLRRLSEIADALDCEVQYILKPKKSLSSFVERQARETATKILGQVNQSMKLEDQETLPIDLKAQIDDLTQELMLTGDKRIWET